MRRGGVTVMVELRLLPDSIEQGKRDLLAFARIVKRSEPGCASIEIVQDLDDPTAITMIEKWSDRATYEGPHLKTPHMQAFIAESSQYFDGPARVSFCQSRLIDEELDRRAAPYGR